MSTEPGLAPQGQKLPLILAAVAVVAVVIPAGLLGGVFAAPATGLPDAGTLVRWGLPIVRAIHDLAMASTVGLLLVAGTIIPEARTTSRRITATRYACASGVVWVLAGLVGLVFSFGSISGTALTDTTFVAQLQTFDFQLDSTLAGWCFVAVAVSGAVNAWIRIGSISNLASSYGALVILKIVALVALGVAGWQQRSRVVNRIAADPLAGRLFGRLALIELAVMGAALALGTALSHSAPPGIDTPVVSPDPAYALTGYLAPGGPLTTSGWFTVWRIDWLWLGVALTAVTLYLVGVRRMRLRGDSWPVRRTIGWVLGWAIFVWATCGAPGVYGRVLFSVHMVMHMTVSMAAPILMVLAAPVTLALRTLAPRHDKTLGPRELLLALVHSRYLAVLYTS